MKWTNYKKELRREASDANEATELFALAKQVSQLKVPNLSAEAKARIAGELGIANRRSFQPWVLGTAMAGAIALVSVVTLAQFSRPGSPLYSVKHQTDKIKQLLLPDASKSPIPSSDDRTGSPAGNRHSGSDYRKDSEAAPNPTDNTTDDKSGSGSSRSTNGSDSSGGSDSPSGDGTSGGDSTSGGQGTISGRDDGK